MALTPAVVNAPPVLMLYSISLVLRCPPSGRALSLSLGARTLNSVYICIGPRYLGESLSRAQFVATLPTALASPAPLNSLIIAPPSEQFDDVGEALPFVLGWWLYHVNVELFLGNDLAATGLVSAAEANIDGNAMEKAVTQALFWWFLIPSDSLNGAGPLQFLAALKGLLSLVAQATQDAVQTLIVGKGELLPHND